MTGPILPFREPALAWSSSADAAVASETFTVPTVERGRRPQNIRVTTSGPCLLVRQLDVPDGIGVCSLTCSALVLAECVPHSFTEMGFRAKVKEGNTVRRMVVSRGVGWAPVALHGFLAAKGLGYCASGP